MKHIELEKRGAVGILTISRRERFNSMDVDTARDFRKAGLQLARDRDVRCAVIRGAGGVFCSGADMKYIRDVRNGGDPSGLGTLGARSTSSYGAVFKQILEYLHSTISEIRRAPKPFVAAVDGIAAAGGFGLAMCCDLVVASERATFEWAYFKTALTGAESSTFLLPRLVGFHRAMELAFLSPRLNAREARDIGLVNRVWPVEDFERETLELAQRLADGPTESYGIAKSHLNHASGMDRLDVHLDRELESLSRIADGNNFAEGITAFFEKRPARFGKE